MAACFAVFAGVAAFGGGVDGARSGAVEAGEKAAPTAPAPESGLPGPAELQVLARRALRDATGRRTRPGPVELGKRLADGSYLVTITLEDGRRVSGRLYRDRMRFRIAVDRRELFSPETTVRIKTQ